MCSICSEPSPSEHTDIRTNTIKARTNTAVTSCVRRHTATTKLTSHAHCTLSPTHTHTHTYIYIYIYEYIFLHTHLHTCTYVLTVVVPSEFGGSSERCNSDIRMRLKSRGNHLLFCCG